MAPLLQLAVQPPFGPILQLTVLLLLQGLGSIRADGDYLETCCSLGSYWGGQNLRCEKFAVPVTWVPQNNQPACLEAVEICCRKALEEQDCARGKADAKAGGACIHHEDRLKSASGADYRRDCCEGCKLGLLTGSSGENCESKKMNLGVSWNPAFMECCKEVTTGTTLDSSSTTPTEHMPLLTSASITEIKKLETDLQGVTDRDTSNTFKSHDLCQLLKGLLCSEICISTPGSYYCKCHEGSILQEDGRSCESSVTTVEPPSLDTTLSLVLSSQNTSSHIKNSTMFFSEANTISPFDGNSTNLKIAPVGARSKNLIVPILTFKMFTIPAKSRSTRSLVTEDNELNLPCPAGYRYTPSTDTCDDIDECIDETHNCGEQKCYNLPGSFQCAKAPLPVSRRKPFSTSKDSLQTNREDNCQIGSRYDKTSNSCVDVNECDEEDACSSNEVCINSPGSFECRCLVGFRRDELTRACVDVNECQLENDCLASQRCDNTIGSYTCVRFLPCGTGYTLNAATEICEDDDECTLGTHDCGAGYHCRNTLGSYRCDKDRNKFTTTTTTRRTPRPTFRTTFTTLAPITPRITAIPKSTTLPTFTNTESTTPSSTTTTTTLAPTTVSTTTTAWTTLRPITFPTPKTTISTTLRPITFTTPSTTNWSTFRPITFTTPNTTNWSTFRPITFPTPKTTISTTLRPISFTTLNTTNWSTFRPITFATTNATNWTAFRPITFTTPKSTTWTVRPTFWITPKSTTLTTPKYPKSTILVKTTTIPTTTTEDIPTVGTLPTINQRIKHIKTIGPKINCPRGLETGPHGQCIDIDECQRNTKICGKLRCINSVGSFRCVADVFCGAGFMVDPISGQCKDIDECFDGTHKCTFRQTCENRHGGYVCICPAGYEVGTSGDCVDVDECTRALPARLCGSDGRCVNNPGSYRCLCNPGFENDLASGSCTDVDECKVNPGACHHQCHNTWGGYRCSCRSGFRLKPDNRTCEDIDECAAFGGSNLCIGICDNTPGSYVCRCPAGYRLDEKGQRCQDIDECLTANTCQPHETCLNIRGGFRCNKIDCPIGYVQEAQRKNRCVRERLTCLVGDVACIQRPAHYSYNYIAILSMYPIPAATGQVELFTMRGVYNFKGSTMRFSMGFISARGPPHVQMATESCFGLRQPYPSQAVLVMTKSLQGPQDIELEFSMEIYGPDGDFAGSAVAKIFIIVSQYEF